MAKKDYRSIRTIFEKAKRGEFAEEYSAAPRLFQKFEFNKRPDLVKPYLHYIDEEALRRSVHNFIMSDNSHREVIKIAKQHNKKLAAPENLGKEIQEIWYKFPKSVLNDMYNLYYNDIQDLQFEPRNIKNKSRFQMLEKVSDPIIKVLTNHNSIKSMIFTRGMIQYYLAMLAMLQQEDPDAFDEMMKQLKGQGSDPEEEYEEEGNGGESENQKDESNSQDESKKEIPSNSAGKGNKKKDIKQLLEDLKKRFDGDQSGSKGILNNIIETAKDAAKNISNVMTEDQQQELWEKIASKSQSVAEKAYNRTDPLYLQNIQKELNKVNISMGNIKDKIKKLLNNSISYFSAKEVPYYENILEVDSLDGLEDWVLLHPKLRKIFIDDINIKNIKKLGKINIYIDVSGSMGTDSGTFDKDGKKISKELFSKAFVYKMKEMNLLNEVYSFQTTVRREGENLYDILTISGGGGTSLTNVVEHIWNKKKNSIVLTDAEDYCGIYCPYAYFIGVSGAKFSSFRSDTLEQYVENKQLVVYDGKNIYNVDNRGRAIK